MGVQQRKSPAPPSGSGARHRKPHAPLTQRPECRPVQTEAADSNSARGARSVLQRDQNSHDGAAGSVRYSAGRHINAAVAQSVERSPEERSVEGSIPSCGTTHRERSARTFVAGTEGPPPARCVVQHPPRGGIQVDALGSEPSAHRACPFDSDRGDQFMDGWPSGLRHLSRKQERARVLRGFESFAPSSSSLPR